jgi:pantoate--beta-alanine ligase
MQFISDAQDLRAAAATLKRKVGLGGVLVPTMGALHEGHAELIRWGSRMAADRRLAPGCIVSIFVNPTQFNDPADLARYPRTLEADLELCRTSGAAAVFVPGPETMYPPPPAPPVLPPPLPSVATTPGLEDAHRPGHFAGVCQVVKRLFELIQPAAAVFGEKDWQQLQVIRAMTSACCLSVEIVPRPTIRDPDGLALSSRNRFLSARQRESALAIARALAAATRARNYSEAEALMARTISASGLRAEYAVVRDAETLGPVTNGRPARSLIAAWSGATRLIDNAMWDPPQG